MPFDAREPAPSRTLIDDIFDLSPAFMCVLKGPEHVFERVNQKYLQLIGYRGDLIGKPAAEILPEAIRQGFIGLLDNVYKTGEPFIGNELQIDLQREPGAPLESRYLDFTYQAITDPSGERVGIFAHGFDVTDKVIARKKLEESEKQLRTYAEAMPQMAFIADGNGEIVYFNQRWYDYIGLPYGKTEGWGWKDAQIHHPDDLERTLRVWKEAVRSGQTYEIEYRLRRHDGEYRWHLGRAVPVRLPDGRITQWLGTNTDIHDQKMHAIQLENARQLAETERQKFEAIFNSSPAAMALFRGPEHVFEKVNPVYQSLYGRELVGKPILEALPEIADQAFVGLLNKVFETGEPFAGKDYHGRVGRTKGGPLEDFYFDFNYERVLDAQGKPYGVYVHAVEVTEKVLARKRLQESERRFRQLADSMPQIVWTADPTGAVTYFNQMWFDYSGWDFERSKGWGWKDFFHPDDLGVIEAFKKSVEAGKPFESEQRFMRGSDGSWRWHLARVVPIWDDAGQIQLWVGTATDIDDQKRTQQALDRANRESREHLAKLEAVFDSLTDGLVFADSDGRILQMNREALKIHQFESHDDMLKMLGDYPGILTLSALDGKTVPFENWPLARVLRGERFNDFEVSLTWSNTGQSLIVNYSGAPIYDEDGGFMLAVLTVRDITQQKRIEADLVKAKEQAEAANELKSAFLANMSHEIRTPLGAMLGFSDLLRDPGLKESERSSYIDILHRNGEQLSHIINDILDLSKVEAGHLVLEHLRMEPAAIASEVVSLLSVKAREKGLILDFEVDRTAPETIVSDPYRTRQILLNLAGNAVKFTQVGSVMIRVSGETSENGETRAVFEVADTGIGIPEEQRDKVFELFVQADGSMTRKFGGTGLGLALSRSLARSLGGDVILLKSRPNSGSVFRFCVLSREDLLAPSLDLPSNESRSDERQAALPADLLAGIRVLLVDDSPDNQQLIWRYLTKKGAEVEIASNGIEAVKKATFGSHDIVLMDIQMPLMDGFTATQKLRERGYAKPIIALTAHAMTEVRIKCLNVGCNAHVQKPVNARELLTAVAQLTRH